MEGMVGATINGKHTYDTYGMILTDMDISSPVPDTKYVAVPGRDGELDFSEVVSGRVRYKPRTITMVLFCEDEVDTWTQRVSDIRSDIAGQMVRLVVDNDKAFFWYGRVSEVAQKVKGRHSEVTIKIIVHPYKYNVSIDEKTLLLQPIAPSRDDMMQYADITVDGQMAINIVCDTDINNFIVIADSNMTMKIGTKSTKLVVGSQLINTKLKAGSTAITLTGTGRVTVNTVGGML